VSDQLTLDLTLSAVTITGPLSTCPLTTNPLTIGQRSCASEIAWQRGFQAVKQNQYQNYRPKTVGFGRLLVL